MNPVSVDVCVVGGGLGGLAVACALKKAGHSVALIERRTDQGDPNRGDFLPFGAVDLLKRFGLALENRSALEIRRVTVELGQRRVARRDLGKRPGLSLAYGQLMDALREHARTLGVDLRLGWQLQGLTSNQSRITGVTAAKDADFGVFEAKLVIGADGRASTVRDALGLRLKMAEKTGEMLACEADLASTSPTLPDSVSFGVGPAGGGFTAPLSGRRVRAVVLTNAGEADALARQSPAALAPELSRRTPLALGSSIDPVRLRTYDQVASGHTTNYATAGAVCIGDAAHPPPAFFQGTVMALLDAEALVRLVSPALKEGDKAIDRALTRFEVERWPDNEKRLDRARKALRWLAPLSRFKLLLLRTPLARLLLSGLLNVD